MVSSLICRKLSSEADLVVVEATPDLIPLLQETMTLNDCDFKLVPGACAPTDEDVELLVQESSTGTGVFGKGRPPKQQLVVPGVSLETLLSKYNLGEFSLVADIEGSEAKFILDEWGHNQVELSAAYHRVPSA